MVYGYIVQVHTEIESTLHYSTTPSITIITITTTATATVNSVDNNHPAFFLVRIRSFESCRLRPM